MAGPYIRFAGLLSAIGSAGLLARSYLAPGWSVPALLLFWAGIAAAYASALAWGLSPQARPWHAATGLALFGGALYLPALLRSPANLIFQDELYHFQSLVLMRDLATSHIPITFFPIAGDYPGLEYTALAALQAAVPLDLVIRLVPLAIHALIPVLAFLTLNAAGLRPRMALLAALIYCTNTSYYFFHATFSYESLGILLFLLVAFLGLKVLNARADALPLRLLLLLALGGIIMTHHVSGLMAVSWLAVGALSSAILRRRQQPLLANVALFAAVLWAGWMIYRAGSSVIYLATSLESRVQAILDFILAEQHAGRQLFWNSPLPKIEQYIARVYPVIVGVLVLCGVLHVGLRWLRGRVRGRQAARLALLGAAGPVVWLATAPLVLTSSSDVVYRSWPFLFVGVSLYCTLGLQAALIRFVRVRGLHVPLMCGVIGLMLAGGIILGDNQAGRFRTTELHSAAGPEDLTPDIISAAQWLEADAGRFNKVWGDANTTTAFSAFGIQDARVWGAWNAYYADDPGSAQWFIDNGDVNYVVVDMRDAALPPRYRFFFNSIELYDLPDDYDPTQPIPLQKLTKFDQVSDLQRIYDNGEIIIYQRVGTKGA